MLNGQTGGSVLVCRRTMQAPIKSRRQHRESHIRKFSQSEIETPYCTRSSGWDE